MQCRWRRARGLLQQMQPVRDNWAHENCSHKRKWSEPTGAHEDCCDKCKQPETTGLSRTVATNANGQSLLVHTKNVVTNAKGQSQLSTRELLQQMQMVKANKARDCQAKVKQSTATLCGREIMQRTTSKAFTKTPSITI